MNNGNNDNKKINNNDKIINNSIKLKKKDSNKSNSKISIKKSLNRLNTLKINAIREVKSNKNIRIIKEIIDPEKYIVSEEELFRKGDGYCFGEWALIYKEPRSASIYTLEDCVFFTLDEVHFRNSFLKSVNNSEYNKKKFALQNFLPFGMMDERQLSIYKNIIPITCNRNQIIFKEGDTSDSIYLIYLGTFTLEKRYGLKQFRVLNLEKGSIVGLESIFEGENSKYKCSLKLAIGLDVGLIFQLKINRLRPYIINKMKISFKTNYKLFIKSWNDLFLKNVFIQQKISKEENSLIKEEKIKNFVSENNKSIEFNNNDFDINWNSVLNMEPEDKYVVLFKDCLKKKVYNNYKKDGSLRIFSSRQSNKICEENNRNSNINNAKYSKNINIIKCFKDISRFDLENANLKTFNSSMKKNKNLNINEIPDNNKFNNSIKIIKKNLNLTNIIRNIKTIEGEEFNRKISQNIKNIILDQKRLKISKNTIILKSKPLKLNKNLLFEANFTNRITPQNNTKKNKYITIRFKNNSLFNKDKNTKNIALDIINQLNIKRIDNKGNDIFKNIMIKNNNEIDINNKINKKNNFINFKEYANLFSKNISFINSNRNISSEKNSFSNNKKSQNSMKKKNKIYYNNSSNFSKINQKKLLFKDGKCSKRIFNSRNESENIRNISLYNNNNLNKVQRSLSPINIKASSSFFKTFDNNNYMNFNIKSEKNKKYNIFDKNKKKCISNNNSKFRNRKYNNSIIYLEENKNILQEMNLSNGFSIPYFEKINILDNINNFQINNNNKPFPNITNSFKVSFDSGDFKIPLISSSIKINKF